MSTKKAILIVLQAIAGVIILVLLIQSAGIERVLNVIPTLNPFYIGLSAAAFIAASTAVALTLFVILNSTSSSSSLGKTIAASFAGQLMSDITPARSGYFLTPLILNKLDKTPVESSLAAVTMTGAINFFVKGGLSILAIVYFMGRVHLISSTVSELLLGALLLAIGGIGSLFLMWSQHVGKITKKLEKIAFAERFIKKITAMVDAFQKEGRKARKSIPATGLLISLSILLNALALQLVAMSLNMTAPFLLDFILMVPLIAAFMYVPLTIAGLGIQESAYVFLLNGLGVQFEVAVLFALLTRALFTGTDIIGLPFLLRAGGKYLE